MKAKQSDDWEAEAAFERLHAHHELYPKYDKAKEAREEQERTHLTNEMGRSDWKQFLTTVSAGGPQTGIPVLCPERWNNSSLLQTIMSGSHMGNWGVGNTSTEKRGSTCTSFRNQIIGKGTYSN